MVVFEFYVVVGGGNKVFFLVEIEVCLGCGVENDIVLLDLLVLW